MWVMTDGTGHPPLEMRAGLPVLYVETIAAVTATTQVACPINRYRVGNRVGRMCSRHRSMARFAGYAVLFPRPRGWVVPGHVADKAGSGFPLVRPHLIKEWVADRMAVLARLPGISEF